MAGHIAGLGYSQRVDANGNPLVGWRLYIYETGTSTPASVYQDYALSIAHSHPIEADATGVMQMFWVDDGTYRVRGTDAQGNELFDDNGIVALGPSSGTGGGGASIAGSAIFDTGDLKWKPIQGTETGWVRCNGRTIGSAASGATERANADAEELFLYLWTNFSDTLCPVGGGRGASAAADWAANKVIAVFDMRSKGCFGLDDMGNTAAGVTGGSTSAAAAIGASTVALTSSNMPVMNITVSTATLVNTATFNLDVANTGISGESSQSFVKSVSDSTGTAADGGGQPVVTSISEQTTVYSLNLASGAISGSVTVKTSGTIPLGGGGQGFSLLNPYRAGTWYIKL